MHILFYNQYAPLVLQWVFALQLIWSIQLPIIFIWRFKAMHPYTWRSCSSKGDEQNDQNIKPVSVYFYWNESCFECINKYACVLLYNAHAVNVLCVPNVVFCKDHNAQSRKKTQISSAISTLNTSFSRNWCCLEYMNSFICCLQYKQWLTFYLLEFLPNCSLNWNVNRKFCLI